jgi:immune inhibitor A
MVSTDDGATWVILDTPHKTLENPHNNAYGPGYTGFSEGWLRESVSLDAYTGQEVLLRFEMITDDATTQPGMLIDDVAIPEIGYASDFETDDGGWQPQGWILTNNSLPQQVWVQAVQFVGSDVEVTRWRAVGDAAWELTLNPGTDQVLLAISPFAPLTTVPMAYELTISAP